MNDFEGERLHKCGWKGQPSIQNFSLLLQFLVHNNECVHNKCVGLFEFIIFTQQQQEQK